MTLPSGKEVKTKDLSVIAKILAAVYVGVGYLGILFVKKDAPTVDQVNGLIMVGAFICGPFLPVDISMWIRNFKNTGG